MVPRSSRLFFIDHKDLLFPLALGVGFVLLAFQNGGAAPSTYELAGAALAVFCAAVAVHSPGRLKGAALVLPLALLGLSAWGFASTSWSADATASVPDAFRVGTYGLFALAVVVGTRGRSIALLAGGAWMGCVAVAAFGVGVRLAPDSSYARTAGVAGRLFAPIGYFNGLAMVAGIGLILALGLILDGTSAGARIAAAASVPVLGLSLYLTLSRGGIGVTLLGVAIAAVSHRTCARVLIAGALCAVAAMVPVAAAVLSPHLTAATLDSRSQHAAVVVGVALVAGCALAVILVRFCLDRIALAVAASWRSADDTMRRVVLVAAAIAAVGAVGVLTLSTSGNADSAPGRPGRLLATTLEARPELWRLASSEFASHPVLGIGAGGFARVWLLHRTTGLEGDFAHSAYLQTAAETGAVGLALLLLAFGFAAAQGIAARRRPFVPACLAAFAMFAVHTAVDWDWQLPAVGLLGVWTAACLVVAHRSADQAEAKTGSVRAVAVTALLVAAAAVFSLGAVGAEHLEAAEHDVSAGHWASAASEARSAHRWMPWSYEPWIASGYAALGSGRRGEARQAFRRGLAVDGAEWKLQFGLAQASEGRSQERALAAAATLNPLSRELRLYSRLEVRAQKTQSH